jgi:hypothetical protein
LKFDVDPLQSVEIQVLGEGIGDELPDELFHHARMGEQPMVQGVRVRHVGAEWRCRVNMMVDISARV